MVGSLLFLLVMLPSESDRFKAAFGIQSSEKPSIIEYIPCPTAILIRQIFISIFTVEYRISLVAIETIINF